MFSTPISVTLSDKIGLAVGGGVSHFWNNQAFDVIFEKKNSLHVNLGVSGLSCERGLS